VVKQLFHTRLTFRLVKSLPETRKENLEATLTGRLKQELTTLIGQSDFATDSSVVNGHNVRKNLEELAKRLPKETDVNDLVESSGVKMLQITIESFVPEDEEDKDALAKKARQASENEGEVQKAKLIAQQISCY
jgi:hypothetical protein